MESLAKVKVYLEKIHIPLGKDQILMIQRNPEISIGES
jgi:hypothetical protein